MTISDERLDMLLRGAKIDAQMQTSARYKREAEEQVSILTELQSLRTTADTEQDGKGVDWRLYHLHVEALAEIKASVDGESDQPIKDIIYGLLAEIEALPDLSTLSNAPQQEAAWDEPARDQARRKASDLLKAKGWKPGDAFSITSMLALMVEFAEQAHTITDRCGYPDCGCDFDASCNPPPPVDPAPSKDEVVTDEMVERAARSIYGSFEYEVAELTDAEAEALQKENEAEGHYDYGQCISRAKMLSVARAALEAALNKGGE